MTRPSSGRDGAVEAALLYVMHGTETLSPVPSNGTGRPASKTVVNGIMLDWQQTQLYHTLVEFWKLACDMAKNEIYTDEQFVAMMKEAAPKLQMRMINMALVSDDLKAVRQVAADLADRGYGKAASQININHSDKDIRGAWKELENKGTIEAIEHDA